MLVGNELGIGAEEEEEEGKVEERVEGANDPEGDEEEEEVLHDELEGREVENEKDEDRGGDGVEDVGNCVIEGETQATIAIAD